MNLSSISKTWLAWRMWWMNFSMVRTVVLSTVLSEWVCTERCKMWSVFLFLLTCVSNRYLLENMDWLEEELGSYDDDYLIIDCPGIIYHLDRVEWSVPLMLALSPSLSFWKKKTGQIELYTHHPFLPTLVRNLQRLGIRTSAVYLLDSQFMEDKYKFFRSASHFFKETHC